MPRPCVRSGVAPYGGADIGECLAAAMAVRGTDLASWHQAWSSTAATVLALAESEAAAGRVQSAHARSFGWLDSILHPERQIQPSQSLPN